MSGATSEATPVLTCYNYGSGTYKSTIATPGPSSRWHEPKGAVLQIELWQVRHGSVEEFMATLDVAKQVEAAQP